MFLTTNGTSSVLVSTPTLRSVGSPTAEYQSMSTQWRRIRAVLQGEAYAKAYDSELDTINYTNLLIPFSPTMTPNQYRWFVAEAQLPGLVAQYLKVMIGGLLRKDPQLELPEVFADHWDWIYNHFTEDNQPLLAFLNEALTEELISSRAWISVDFPRVTEDMDDDTRAQLKPYPVLWKADEIINWQVTRSAATGRPELVRAVFRYVSKDYTEDNPYHPTLVPTVVEHYVDEEGIYTVDSYKQVNAIAVRLDNGEYSVVQQNGGNTDLSGEGEWELVDSVRPQIQGSYFSRLPIFPLNGNYEPVAPMLAPMVDKEISLYNKVSRRNHLLYGAATYTPYVKSDTIGDEDFRILAQQGLGTWFKVGSADSIEIVTPPTEALSSYENAISQDVEELTMLGIRILAPEAGESGISLSIRNSTQLAQLGLLNTRVSQTMLSVISLMLQWATGEALHPEDVDFSLSADFDPTPLGGDWMRMVSEWYQQGLVPRSLWIRVAKLHDIIPADYDDEEGQQEIAQDPQLAANQDYQNYQLE